MTRYDQILYNLYGDKPHKEEIRFDSDQFIVAGLFKDCDVTENVKVFQDLGIKVVLVGNKDPKIDGVDFYDDSLVVNSFKKQDSLPQYRPLYAYNRINKMVVLRNYCNRIIINYPYEYYILVDMDLKIHRESVIQLLNGAHPSFVKTSLGIQVKDYTNISGNIKVDSHGSIVYYDTSAYRDAKTDRYGAIHDHLNAHMHAILGGVIRECITNKWNDIQVESAFGGMACYPRACALYEYSLVANPNKSSNVEYECEHVDFHEKLRSAGFKIFIDKRAIVEYVV